MILENPDGVWLTGQKTGQKMKISEIADAVETAKELTEDIFPQYKFSPVYLHERGEIPVGWFQMKMPDRGTEHIKAFSVVQNEMIMLTFTYPGTEEIKWKSMILDSFGTWRESHGEN